MIQKNIQIRVEQDIFLKEQKLSFNFSKFVRSKLDEYVTFKKNWNKKKQESIDKMNKEIAMEVENDKRNKTVE